jgi:predicted DCC family thiol-disulfide oxidoreductase YuxK
MTRSETCTVYFDGACPVCRSEIAHYRRQRGSESIAWVDASSCAAAFVAIWRRLPAFSWLAALASSAPVHVIDTVVVPN